MAQASRSALDALFANKSSGDKPGADTGGESAKPAPPASLDDLFKK
jgi:hypothetical protein